MIRSRVVIRGVVQGVGFRATLARIARTNGVAGWVRNRGDGAVEAVFEGEPEAVEMLLAWCARGPRGAEIDEVEQVDERPEGLESFAIR